MIFSNYYTDKKSDILNLRKEKILESNKEIDLILFGDSITEGFDINRYAYTNKVYINSAISGDQTKFMYKRFERDVLDYRPKQILLMAGVNDIREWYKINERYTPEFEFVKNNIILNLKNMIKKAHRKNIEVFLCLIIKNYEQHFNYVVINSLIDSVNCEIRVLAEKFDVKLIDYNEVLLNEWGCLDLNYTNDGLHPNEFGYIKMCSLLDEVLIKKFDNN